MKIIKCQRKLSITVVGIKNFQKLYQLSINHFLEHPKKCPKGAKTLGKKI